MGINIGGKPKSKKKYEKSYEDKFNESIYNTDNRGKKYNPYNNTGNYLKKIRNYVSESDYVNIYLDKYKSKKNQENNEVPYGFYIINHSDPKLKGLFFNIIIPEWVDDTYPDIKGSLIKLGSLRIDQLHDENNIKRIEYIDMINSNEEQNPEICEMISKNEEKEAQTKILQKKIKKLENEIAEIEQKKEEDEKNIEKIEIKNVSDEKKLQTLQFNLKETNKRLKILQDNLKEIIQQLENIDTFNWTKDDKRMLITPKFKSLVDTDHPTNVCSKSYDRSPWWDQLLFEQTNDWESIWMEKDNQTIQFKNELDNLNEMYCKNKIEDERTCTSSKPWYKTSIDRLCDFQPGNFYNGCEINEENAKILVKEREKLYDDCMYRQSCQTDAGMEYGIPKYFRPYMKGKYFPTTGNKDIPICCKRSFVAVVENVLTIKKLEEVFEYKPLAVFRAEITELVLDRSVEKMLIKNHEKEEKYLKESIQQEENISNTDVTFYKNIGEIVKKTLEQDFEKIIDNTGKLMLSQNEEGEEANTSLEDIDDEKESFYTQLKSSISNVFGEVKKLGSGILEKTIEIMKKGAQWLFFNCGPFVMALKWLCDKIKVGLCIGTSGKLINDELQMYYNTIKNQVSKIWDEPQKELNCEQFCETKYNDGLIHIKNKFPESAKRQEEANKSTVILDSNYAENPEDNEADYIIESDRLYNEAINNVKNDKDKCNLFCKAKSYIIPYINPYITPPNPLSVPIVNETERMQSELNIQHQKLQDILQKMSLYESRTISSKSGGKPYGPLNKEEYENELAKRTEDQAKRKKEEEAASILMSNRLERLKKSDILNYAIYNASESVKDIIPKLSEDRSVSNVKAILTEKATTGVGLLRNQITNIYIEMKRKIYDLPSFIKYTLFSTTSYFEKTFKKVWDNLVLILSSVLESVVNILTFGLINKLNIPLSQTSKIFFDPIETAVSKAIYQRYIFMVQETEEQYPNSSIMSFFKEWHVCSLDKIKFFDMSKININIKTIDKETKFECNTTDTIDVVLNNLRKKLDIPSDHMILLTFENQEIDSNLLTHTLADYAVKNGSTIKLTVKPLVLEPSPKSDELLISNGGYYRKMGKLYDEKVLTKLYQTYKKKRLSKNEKSYLHNIMFMILNNVRPFNYTQSHKNILLLMLKE